MFLAMVCRRRLRLFSSLSLFSFIPLKFMLSIQNFIFVLLFIDINFGHHFFILIFVRFSLVKFFNLFSILSFIYNCDLLFFQI